MSALQLLQRSAEAEGPAIICPQAQTSCFLQFPADCELENCIGNFTIIVFPFIALFIGIISTPIAKQLNVSYTIFLLLVGIILGIAGCGIDLGILSTSLRQWVHLNPPGTFFYVFLAPLIFEASFNTRWHVFKRLLSPILTAAFVIVMLQAGLIATFQKVAVRTEGWTWWAALMLGSMLSATDPIAVTSTLKALGASEFLNTLIEGESLVNDGSAFVLWEAFFDNTKDPDALGIGDIVRDIFRLSIGGMLMGVAFGLVSLLILGLIYDEFEVETSLTVIVAFLGFWTAQAPSRLSGVICNVASGLIISAFGRHLITPKVRHPLAEFWELLAWIANTIVFVHAGVLLSAFTWSCAGDPHQASDYFLIFGYYFFLQFIRIGLILLFKPLMAIGNKWYGWREALVVGFSGLRGSVSLVLALEVAGSDKIPPGVKSRVVLWTTGIVALSLLVNGFLIKPLVTKLRLNKAEESREEFLNRARALMVQQTLTILDSLSIETAFKAVKWSYVVTHVLPDEWLHEANHAQQYLDAMENLIGNNAASMRKSLENVKTEHFQMLQSSRMSQEIIGGYTPGSPKSPSSPIPGSTRVSLSLMPGAIPSSLRASMDRHSLENNLMTQPAMANVRASIDNTKRSIDYDLLHYGPSGNRKVSQNTIHEEVAELHGKMRAGHEYDLADKDWEVRRRLLTTILTQVRSLSNTTLVEFNVLHNLESDVQTALDANEERREYDLFSFLDNRGRQRKSLLYKFYLRVIEGKKLRGQTSITTALLIFDILTTVLKEKVLEDSSIVTLQAEQLYEAAAATLNRLDALNPVASAWVQSQLAIQVAARKQDHMLHDMLASGSIDHEEYGTIHEELVELRRKHVNSRQSILHSHHLKFRPPPQPRQLQRQHPLFRSVPPAVYSMIVGGYGELVHLRSGQALRAEKGALILVLEGAIRPIEESVLYTDTVGEAHKRPDGGSSAGDSGDGDIIPANLASGATMHWCFGTHSGFCGQGVVLDSHQPSSGPACAIAVDRLQDQKFCCCDIAGSATVFTLPVDRVRRLAQESPEFRIEISRSLAREMVLESVADQRPYELSHYMTSLHSGVDVHSLVGRAYRVLERLPYMDIIQVTGGEKGMVFVEGPGILLNGTVRVSVVDTSGLTGAVNLLHEELTGPALLPAGGLEIEDVLESEEGKDDPSGRSNLRNGPVTRNATEMISSIVSGGKYRSLNGQVIAHVLAIDVTDPNRLASRRMNRWTRDPVEVDMNGRFGMHRHVELAPFIEAKIV